MTQHSQSLQWETFLGDAFTTDELRRLVRTHLGDEATAQLPGSVASHKEITTAVIALLQRHRALDDQFVQVLTLLRPRRRKEIAILAGQVELTDVSAPTQANTLPQIAAEFLERLLLVPDTLPPGIILAQVRRDTVVRHIAPAVAAELCSVFPKSTDLEMVEEDARSLIQEIAPHARALGLCYVPLNSGALIAWRAALSESAKIGATAFVAILPAAQAQTDKLLGGVQKNAGKSSGALAMTFRTSFRKLVLAMSLALAVFISGLSRADIASLRIAGMTSDHISALEDIADYLSGSVNDSTDYLVHGGFSFFSQFGNYLDRDRFPGAGAVFWPVLRAMAGIRKSQKKRGSQCILLFQYRGRPDLVRLCALSSGPRIHTGAEHRIADLRPQSLFHPQGR